MTTCSATSCDRPRLSRGLCRRHLNRLFASPTAPKENRCGVRGCKRWRIVKGWCHLHYSRWKNNGTPGGAAPLIKRKPYRLEGAVITANGYRKIRTPTGDWVLEHRWVMSKTLGRPLLPYESVHHIDGNRLNNTPRNLELWVKRQPSGQRVTDLIKWARWILRTYKKGSK